MMKNISVNTNNVVDTDKDTITIPLGVTDR